MFSFQKIPSIPQTWPCASVNRGGRLGNGDCGSAAISAALVPGSAARVLPLIPTFAWCQHSCLWTTVRNRSSFNKQPAEEGLKGCSRSSATKHEATASRLSVLCHRKQMDVELQNRSVTPINKSHADYWDYCLYKPISLAKYVKTGQNDDPVPYSWTACCRLSPDLTASLKLQSWSWTSLSADLSKTPKSWVVSHLSRSNSFHFTFLKQKLWLLS